MYSNIYSRLIVLLLMIIRLTCYASFQTTPRGQSRCVILLISYRWHCIRVNYILKLEQNKICIIIGLSINGKI